MSLQFLFFTKCFCPISGQSITSILSAIVVTLLPPNILYIIRSSALSSHSEVASLFSLMVSPFFQCIRGLLSFFHPPFLISLCNFFKIYKFLIQSTFFLYEIFKVHVGTVPSMNSLSHHCKFKFFSTEKSPEIVWLWSQGFSILFFTCLNLYRAFYVSSSWNYSRSQRKKLSPSISGFLPERK